jgi:TM2 domain-containing membrane protein YozV
MPAKSKSKKKPKVTKTVHQQFKELEMRRRRSTSVGLAIAALLLNILVLPGLGSLIGGRIRSGIIQVFLAVLGFLLSITLIGAIIGVPMMIIAWIWALITGINIVKDSD